MNGPGSELGAAAKTGTARWEDGWLQAGTAELVSGLSQAPGLSAGRGLEHPAGQRGRVNPFGSRELVDQPRCHLNPLPL